MSRRRGSIFIGAGIVLALLTGVLVFRMLRQTAPAAVTAEAPAASAGATVALPVAAQPLSAGQTISTTDIVERRYPADLVPAGVVTDTSTLVGQAVGEAVQPGELFRASQLGDTEQRLSQELEPNKVAITFPILDPLLQQGGAINEGDHVDVLLTLDVTEAERSGKSTSITLQNIRVLRVMRGSGADSAAPAQGLVLEMTSQEALIAKHIKDSGGVIDLALRSPQDEQPFAAESINRDYLLDRYRFRAPVSGSAQP